MCGPLVKCCCLPIQEGVRVICVILTVIEVAFAVWNGFLINSSNMQFIEITGQSDVNYFIIQLIAIIVGYSLAITVNVVLFIATVYLKRWMFLPWLLVYLIAIIGCFLGTPLVIVWYTFVQPLPIFALLCLVPFFLGLFLLYCWVVVNGYFIKLGIDAIIDVRQQQSKDEEEKTDEEAV